MASPSTVRIDAQGRLVIPHQLRGELFDTPGEVSIERTTDGLLLRPAHAGSQVSTAADGLPVLSVDGPITNEDVLAAIAAERSRR